MGNFYEEQGELIAKLEKAQNVFGEVRAKDRRRLVIQYGDRNTLDNLVRKNENMLKKLKNHEFTVAVVGLEKAGKSTLANALLKLIVLPEYTERCTYTTTEIRSGNVDVAEVYFYSREKFEQNFQRMLKDVGYTTETTFEQLNIGDFERFWREVQNTNADKFQQHNGTTVEDIRAMLNAKDVMDYLLGKEPEHLDITVVEDYQKLYQYITGIENYKNGHVERTAEPYAVEKVIIKSTGLTDMKNIIMYDVPGFDSPTELHKKQTEDMLKMCDAIILVTNVGDRPNLTGTQLDMLQKVRDEDGISLNEKVFVFGNKLDMAGNAQLAKDNVAALVHDAVDKYSIAKANRIICGSAKAYLERHGKLSQDDKARGIRDINATMDKWGISDGIDELKTKMQSYYNEDRFEILKRRAEKTIADIKSFLRSILAKYSTAGENVDVGEEYFLQAKDSLADFSKRASDIGREYRDKVTSDEIFTAFICDNIEEIFPSETGDSPIISNAEKLGNSGEGYALSRIDALSREQLYFSFSKNIVMKTASIALAHENEIYQRLADELLKALGIDEDSPNIQELEQDAQKLLQSFLIENGEHCYFNPLIERYATVLIEALIRSPYASAERLKKLTDDEILPDFKALAIYYESVGGEEDNEVAEDRENVEDSLSSEDKSRYFTAKILTHEEISPPNAEDNEKSLRDFFKAHDTNLAMGFDFNTLPFETWSILLAKIGIKVSESDLLERTKQALIKFVGVPAWSKMQPKAKNEMLNNAMIRYFTTKKPDALSDYLKALNQKIRSAQTKEEMIELLNRDIEILREFTLKSVVKAIGLERAFNSIMAKNIDLIRESLGTPEGQQVFNQWLKANLRKIRAADYAVVDQNIELLREKQAIAESIRPLLSKLDE
ncbi:MAG: dynamin family protein [Selenomonadaceae bacterium]|nr:dynamin family protein [Selenomonadaceae bacterium]